MSNVLLLAVLFQLALLQESSACLERRESVTQLKPFLQHLFWVVPGFLSEV